MNEQEKQNHAKIKRKLKIIGISVLVVAITFTLIGFINFFTAFSARKQPTLFWCTFIGLPLLGVGLGITVQAFRREISQYTAQECIPAAQTFLEGVTHAAAGLAKEITSPAPVVCACGTENDQDDKFCKNCGAPLSETCPHCNERLDPDSKFCTNCGKEL